MSNQNFNLNSDSNFVPTEEPEFENPKKKSKLPSKRRLFVVFGIIALIVIAVLLIQYFEPEAVERREGRKNTEEFVELYEGWQKQLSEDTYGGKTPQETLNMFIEALRNEDLELASKYFAPEMDEENPEKMTWQGHLEYLQGMKEKGFIQRMADDLENYDNEHKFAEGRYSFLYYNNDGTTSIQIVTHFNENSGVWKIENYYE